MSSNLKTRVWGGNGLEPTFENLGTPRGVGSPVLRDNLTVAIEASRHTDEPLNTMYLGGEQVVLAHTPGLYPRFPQAIEGAAAEILPPPVKDSSLATEEEMAAFVKKSSHNAPTNEASQKRGFFSTLKWPQVQTFSLASLLARFRKPVADANAVSETSVKKPGILERFNARIVLGRSTAKKWGTSLAEKIANNTPDIRGLLRTAVTGLETDHSRTPFIRKVGPGLRNMTARTVNGFNAKFARTVSFAGKGRSFAATGLSYMGSGSRFVGRTTLNGSKTAVSKVKNTTAADAWQIAVGAGTSAGLSAAFRYSALGVGFALGASGVGLAVFGSMVAGAGMATWRMKKEVNALRKQGQDIDFGTYFWENKKKFLVGTAISTAGGAFFQAIQYAYPDLIPDAVNAVSSKLSPVWEKIQAMEVGQSASNAFNWAKTSLATVFGSSIMGGLPVADIATPDVAPVPAPVAAAVVPTPAPADVPPVQEIVEPAPTVQETVTVPVTVPARSLGERTAELLQGGRQSNRIQALVNTAFAEPGSRSAAVIAQAQKDLAQQLFARDSVLAMDLYQSAATAGNHQAVRDMAFNLYHGRGHLTADPAGAIAQLREVAARYPAQSSYRDLLGQWTGERPRVPAGGAAVTTPPVNPAPAGPRAMVPRAGQDFQCAFNRTVDGSTVTAACPGMPAGTTFQASLPGMLFQR